MFSRRLAQPRRRRRRACSASLHNVLDFLLKKSFFVLPETIWYTQFINLQAVLAINCLGPSTAARARSISFLRTCCSTYTTTSHFLSVKTQKCDPTCTSPATGRSGTHSGPGNTTRQICTIRRGGHVPKAPPVRTLTGRTHRSCMRAPPAPLTCPAAPGRLLPLRIMPPSHLLKILGRRSSSFALGGAAARPRCPRCRWRGVIATSMRRLPSGCCFPDHSQLPLAAARRAASPP